MAYRKSRVRSTLIANKEKDPRVFSKAMQERWGFYRPLNNESIVEISDVLDLAVPSIEYYFKRKRLIAAPIEIQNSFAVTFVRRSLVGRKMSKAIKFGFRMSDAVEDLSQEASCMRETIEVPLDWEQFAWYSKGERKAVAKFAESKELDRLYDESTAIEVVLGEHGLKNVVSPPDHVTLFQYGERSDNANLTNHYRREILHILKNYFDDKSVKSIMLDPLNVGPTYTESCEPWEKACS